MAAGDGMCIIMKIACMRVHCTCPGVLQLPSQLTAADPHLHHRVWKIPEESQLIYRAQGSTLECCKYLTGTEWVSGSAGGGLQLWSQMKKRPMFNARGAHGAAAPPAPGMTEPPAPAPTPSGAGEADVTGWVQSVAVCKGTDLLASGAGDGCVRLWRAAPGASGSALHSLQCVGGLPARGFVNGLAIARSGKFLIAGLGQEPRLGRWLRNPQARNGLLFQPLEVREDKH